MTQLEAEYGNIIRNGKGKYYNSSVKIEAVTVSGITLEGSLIVKMTIPLPERTVYELNRLYAIPQAIDKVKSLVLRIDNTYVPKKPTPSQSVQYSQAQIWYE